MYMYIVHFLTMRAILRCYLLRNKWIITKWNFLPSKQIYLQFYTQQVVLQILDRIRLA